MLQHSAQESQTNSTDLSSMSIGLTTTSGSGVTQLSDAWGSRNINNNNKNNNNNRNNHWEANMITQKAKEIPQWNDEYKLNLSSLVKNYKDSSTITTSSRTLRGPYSDRRPSTSTLNRLILVAQALETEVEFRRRTNLSIKRVVVALRSINLILLLSIIVLLITGYGQYSSIYGGRQFLLLTPDKWYYGHHSGLPITFAEMRLLGQFLATSIVIIVFAITIIVHLAQIFYSTYSRLMCMCYSFASVPFILFVFGLQMHYCMCPWIYDFYRLDILRSDYHSTEQYFDTQCGISGWALAGIFSLLSCSLFVSEGLVSAFFRSESYQQQQRQRRQQRQRSNEKINSFL